MKTKIILLGLIIAHSNCASATENVSVCFARSDKSDCIQASAQLEVDYSRKKFNLTTHFEDIKCWPPNAPIDQSGRVVENQGFDGRTEYLFITTSNRIIGSVRADLWTATYSGMVDGFNFVRCGID